MVPKETRLFANQQQKSILKAQRKCRGMQEETFGQQGSRG